jgi:hypothetical protein
MPRLFRAMKENEAGLPEEEDSARALGIRPGIDVPVSKPEELLRPGQGGMSVSPDDPLNLPAFRRPAEYQGVGKDPVWTISSAELGPDLSYRSDPASAGHGFIEPARPMTLGDYQRALSQTHGLWRKATPAPAKRSDSNDA